MTNMCGLRRNAGVKHGKMMMQAQRQDGKILEFTTPILVEDLLQKFPGAAGVGLSHHHHLPVTYKLKLGRMYYLLPKTIPQASAGGTKRIKVVITKQQLQQLLSNQISIQDVHMLQDKHHNHPCTIRSWRPKLQSIPEGVEDE